MLEQEKEQKSLLENTNEPITITNVILTVLIFARGITPSDRTLRMLDSIC